MSTALRQAVEVINRYAPCAACNGAGHVYVDDTQIPCTECTPPTQADVAELLSRNVCPVISVFISEWSAAITGSQRLILWDALTHAIDTRASDDIEEQRAWMAAGFTAEVADRFLAMSDLPALAGTLVITSRKDAARVWRRWLARGRPALDEAIAEKKPYPVYRGDFEPAGAIAAEIASERVHLANDFADDAMQIAWDAASLTRDHRPVLTSTQKDACRLVRDMAKLSKSAPSVPCPTCQASCPTCNGSGEVRTERR